MRVENRKHIHLQVRQNWFANREVNPCNGLHSGVVNAPNIATFKIKAIIKSTKTIKFEEIKIFVSNT